jgi:hypothetical protein
MLYRLSYAHRWLGAPILSHIPRDCNFAAKEPRDRKMRVR